MPLISSGASPLGPAAQELLIEGNITAAGSVEWPSPSTCPSSCSWMLWKQPLCRRNWSATLLSLLMTNPSRARRNVRPLTLVDAVFEKYEPPIARVPPLLLISPQGSRNEIVTRYELRN